MIAPAAGVLAPAADGQTWDPRVDREECVGDQNPDSDVVACLDVTAEARFDTITIEAREVSATSAVLYLNGDTVDYCGAPQPVGCVEATIPGAEEPVETTTVDVVYQNGQDADAKPNAEVYPADACRDLAEEIDLERVCLTLEFEGPCTRDCIHRPPYCGPAGIYCDPLEDLGGSIACSSPCVPFRMADGNQDGFVDGLVVFDYDSETWVYAGADEIEFFEGRPEPCVFCDITIEAPNPSIQNGV